MKNDTKNRTGLLCLQFLFGQVRRNVNFSSLITDNLLEEYQKNTCECNFDASRKATAFA